MQNHHRRSRAANLSQPGVEPQKGSQLHDTEQKNRRCSRTSWTDTPKEAQQEPTSPPEGGEEEDTALLLQKEKPQTQKQGPPEKVACS